jgi:hypothetical protein
LTAKEDDLQSQFALESLQICCAKWDSEQGEENFKQPERAEEREKMKALKNLLIGAACAAACGSLVQAASANVISDTSASFSGGSSFTAQIPLFNPALGTLTSATISLNAQLTPDAAVYNSSGTAQPFIYAFCTTLATNPVTNQVIFVPNPAVWTDPYGNSAQTDFTVLVQNGMANPGINDYPGTPLPADLISSVPAPDLGTFQGAGTAAFTYTATGDGNDGGSDAVGGLYYGGGYQYAGTDTVTYTYTPVPEPTSLSLLGLGSLAVLRRRRHA